MLALLEISHGSGSPLKIMDLVEHGAFFSKGNILTKGQTTEIIETRKMEKTEFDVLDTIAEIIAKAKK